MKAKGIYMTSTSMEATRGTMALASTVLGFDILELWTEAESDKLHCIYVHATEKIVQRYPDLITGHFPEHKSEHKLSPAVIFIYLNFIIFFLNFMQIF